MAASTMFQDQESSKQAYRAYQAWIILVGYAHMHRITTYDELAKVMGYRGASQFMGGILGLIMHYCQQCDLPPLTAIVVSQETGLPGVGFTAAEETPAAQQQVFSFPWFQYIPPTPAEFAAAVGRNR